MKCYAIAMGLILCCCSLSADRITFFATDFDDLAPGPTQHHPGDEAQDGWYYGTRPDFDQIQQDIVVDGQALRLFIDADDTEGAQTNVLRPIEPPDLSRSPVVTLEADFYAATSDPEAKNEYQAALEIVGGPHPGFVILGFGLSSGNGTAKNIRNVDVGLACFNGLDNNVPVPLTVGQTLEWETWHHIKLVIDQRADRYVSLTVNDETQTLSEYALPRSFDWDTQEWKRGQRIEQIQTAIRAYHWANEASTDDIYWDNLELYGQCPLIADLSGDCVVDLHDLALFAAEWLMGTE